MPAKKEIVGLWFGRLLVVEECEKSIVLCRCDCGKDHHARRGDLRSGRTTSCGCRKVEVTAARNWKHGMCVRPEYEVWLAMKRRCSVTSHACIHYHDRGIGVCERWMDSFVSFLEDIGARPSPKHTLERIDNNKGYEPGNVRWATRAEQNRNTRQNVWITFQGRTACLAEWSKELGVARRTLADRLKTMSVEKAFTTPLGMARIRLITFNGQTKKLSEWSRQTGLRPSTILNRLRVGWSVEETLTRPSREAIKR